MYDTGAVTLAPLGLGEIPILDPAMFVRRKTASVTQEIIPRGLLNSVLPLLFSGE